MNELFETVLYSSVVGLSVGGVASGIWLLATHKRRKEESEMFVAYIESLMKVPSIHEHNKQVSDMFDKIDKELKEEHEKRLEKIKRLNEI